MGKEGMNGDDFATRRAALRTRVNELDRNTGGSLADRTAFFDAVYETASGDEAAIPWADLKPKERLTRWLGDNPGNGRAAIDVGCGLGDNAEAIARAGWATTAFDVSSRAVGWALHRFPGSPVDYRVADLSHLPPPWAGAFDLVHECYTIQAVPGELRTWFAMAIASLVAPGGTLLVYARSRPTEADAGGPPWPLSPREARIFADMGFALVAEEHFDIVRPDRSIPHLFAVWQRVQ